MLSCEVNSFDNNNHQIQNLAHSDENTLIQAKQNKIQKKKKKFGPTAIKLRSKIWSILVY